MARVTWSIPLPGPFRVSGTVGGRKRHDRRRGEPVPTSGAFHGTMTFLTAGMWGLFVWWPLVSSRRAAARRELRRR